MNKSLWRESSRWRLLVVGAAACLGLAIVGANLGRPTVVSTPPPPRASFNPPAPPAPTIAAQTPAAVAAPPDQLQNFNFNTASAGPAVCTFAGVKFPDDMLVYAAGGYSGRKLDFQIDQSGHAATQFDVAVNSPSRPVALMLGAYEPTIWNIGWTPDTRIVAVFVSGHHRQAIAGLASAVPVANSSDGACGSDYFYVGKDDNRALNPIARQLFGKPVDMVFPGTKSGVIAIGEQVGGGIPLLSVSATSPESFRDANAPRAGQAGLDDAVANGVLRPATAADLDAWAAAVAGRGTPKPSLTKAYVVLKAFTYPAGLTGGKFFIPAGVPAPKGNPGHSIVFNFNTLECLIAGRIPCPGYGSQGSGTTPAVTPGPSTSVTGQAAATQASPDPARGESFMGKVFSDSVTLEREVIPLPDGRWITLAHFRASPGSTNGDAVILGRIKNGKLDGLIAINAHSLAPGSTSSLPAFAGCTRNDYLVRHSEQNQTRGQQRCWWINHAVEVWTQQPIFRAALEELSRRGVTPPTVMLNVGFHRATANGFATAFHYFDPASENISSTNRSWSESEWHKSRIASDPARVRYVQQLERWGEGWAPIFFVIK